MFKGSTKTIGFRQWRQNLDHLFCEFFASSKHSNVRFYSLGSPSLGTLYVRLLVGASYKTVGPVGVIFPESKILSEVYRVVVESITTILLVNVTF